MMKRGARVRFFWKKTVFAVILLLFSGCGYSVPSYHSARINSRTRYADTAYARNKSTVQVASNEENDIVVRQGDTVYSLSRRHDVPIRTLIEINGLRAPYVLSVGQRLKRPVVSTHIVDKGETVYSISRRYGVDMSTLVRQNNIYYPYAIVPGQVLVIPGSVVQSAGKTAAKKKYAAASKKSKPSKTIRLPTPPSREAGRFAWPLKGKITAEFGSAGAGRHNDGINIKAEKGTPVKAAENGVVAYAGNELKGFGNLLLLKHADGWVTAYAHNSKLLVKRGQTVNRGDVIAHVGKTGSATEPQLHFEIRKGTKAVNPRNYLSL